MGISVSSLEKLKQHRQLNVLCSSHSVILNDSEADQRQFWQDLLNFEIDLTKIHPKDLLFAVKYYCDQLVINNNSTRNYNALLIQTIHCLNDVSPENKITIKCATNAVFFLRTFTQYFIENMNAQQLKEFLSIPPNYKQKVIPIFRQYIYFNNPNSVIAPDSSSVEDPSTTTDILLASELMETVVNFLIDKDFKDGTSS